MHFVMSSLVYLIVCLAIGFFGRNRKLTFWGYFFGSLLLTPIVGLILIFASDPRKK